MTDISASHEIEAPVDGRLVGPDFTPWLDCGARALRGWMETNSAMLQSSVGFAEQMTAFSQSRLKTDLDLWKTLSGCGNVSEFFGCQMKYVERTTSDYLGAAKGLAGRMLGVVDATTLPLHDPARRL